MEPAGDDPGDELAILRMRLRGAGFIDLDEADAVRRAHDPTIRLPGAEQSRSVQERNANLEGFLQRNQEGIRSRLAVVIVLSIPATVILAFVVLSVIAIMDGISVDDLKDIIATTLTPLVGLAGAVIGFYFGSQRHGGPS